MLLIERAHNVFHFISEFEGFNFRWVRQSIHHIGHTTVLQRLGDSFPTILNQLGRITSTQPFLDHFVETKQRACLQHSAEDGLLSHQVRLNLSNKGRHQHTSLVTSGPSSISLCYRQTLASWIVVFMDSNECRYTKATLIFLTYFSAWTFRCHHNDCNIFTNLHALFYDVKTVRVGKARILFH